MRNFLFVLFSSLFFVSCIPLKEQVYLQDKDNSKKDDVNQISIKPYRLQVNDVVSIKIKTLDSKFSQIFNNSTSTQNQNISAENLYFNGYSVDDHGNVRIPVIGELNVLGYTTDDVRKKIEEILLKDYFQKEAYPFVEVKLSGFRFTVNGEVKTPGTKFLFQDRVTILEAIANAGDIEITGDRKDVKVIRQFPNGSEVFSIDLTDKSAMNSIAYNLQPNDYVYVKPLKQKSWGTGKTGIESLSTVITILSLATTTFLLFKN